MREYGPSEVDVVEVLDQRLIPRQSPDEHVPVGVALPEHSQTPKMVSYVKWNCRDQTTLYACPDRSDGFE
jgi:hypothetical protein